MNYTSQTVLLEGNCDDRGGSELSAKGELEVECKCGNLLGLVSVLTVRDNDIKAIVERCERCAAV